MNMRIIHFSTADNEGGSARSAYRIHCGLRELGHDSKMLVGKKVTSDTDVSTVYGNFLGRLLDAAADRLTRYFGHQYLYVPSGRRVSVHPWVKKADIIQLFNTHGGYFSHRLLPQLSKQAPIVWRLSDMWPMTAHSAYTYDCDCWKRGPAGCVCKLESYPPIYSDKKRMLWDIKDRIYDNSDITVVAPSSWIENMARESLLLSRFQTHKIPNGIDLRIFYPRDKMEARKRFNIDSKSKVILFSAHGLDDNPRKGSKLLIEALNKLGRIPNILLLLAGEGGDSFASAVSMPVKKLGYIADRDLMAQVYSSADVSLVPSVVENLPNNLLESMACGVPAVAFDAGGIRDAVIHMETGYLAEYGDTDDFAYGLHLMLMDDKLRGELGRKAKALIEQQFDRNLEIKRFEELYKMLVEKRSKEI